MVLLFKAWVKHNLSLFVSIIGVLVSIVGLLFTVYPYFFKSNEIIENNFNNYKDPIDIRSFMPKKPIENMLATLYIYDENEKFFPVRSHYEISINNMKGGVLTDNSYLKYNLYEGIYNISLISLVEPDVNLSITNNVVIKKGRKYYLKNECSGWWNPSCKLMPVLLDIAEFDIKELSISNPLFTTRPILYTRRNANYALFITIIFEVFAFIFIVINSIFKD